MIYDLFTDFDITQVRYPYDLFGNIFLQTLSRKTRFGATLKAICNVNHYLLRLNFLFPINLEIDQIIRSFDI